MTSTMVTPKQADTLNRACLADKIRLLNRVITSTYDAAFRPLGITTSQINILTVIAKYQQASPGQLGQWLYMEKSTLSRNLDLMHKRGWVETLPGRGRAHAVKMTTQGHRILQEGLPLWELAQRKTRALLGARGAKEVVRMGSAVRQ